MTTIIKSLNDKKDYRPITLNNQLRVLIISDPDAEKSAGSLVINVGHFNDPNDIQGMAHFLEHMMFLGTENYPEPDAYQQFISGHGGSHNAWTGTEFTNFFFDIDYRFFEEALDRFSQFFISPLFSEEFVEKERLAIDSEYRVKLNDDIRRLYDAHKETVNPDHPFCKFSVGSKDTLGIPDASELRARLVQFHRENYSANLMTLAVIDKRSLDDIEAIVKSRFESIVNKQFDKPVVNQALYLPEHLQHELLFKPLKAGKKLILSFAMPGIDDLYRKKPLSYLSMLLGHEGEGSLLSALKKEGLATGLSAGGGINGSNFKDFNISVQLTEEGMSKHDAVIAMVLSFIELMKADGFADWRYQEKVSLARLSFMFQEKTRAMDTVSHLAVNMQHYPEQDYVFGDFAMEGMDRQTFAAMCKYLRTDNMRIVNIDGTVETDTVSKWYNADYAFKSIEANRIASWNENIDTSKFTLPQPNPYIVDDVKAQDVEHKAARPSKVLEREGLSVWHHQDEKFRVPKGHIYIAFDCPKSVENTRSLAITRIYVELFLDSVNEKNYQAELAGLSYHLYCHQGGVSLHFSGLSTRQHILVAELLACLQTWQTNAERFAIFKQQMINGWSNSNKNKSISQLFSKLGELLQPNSPPSHKLSAELQTVDFAEFEQFKSTLFDETHVDALLYGDWTRAQASKVAENIETNFFAHTQSIEEVKRPIALLPANTNTVRELIIPDHDPAIAIYYQAIDKSPKEIALFSLFNHLISPHFFHELRTQRQFGYIVGTGYVPFNQYPGMAFYIQSPKVSPFDMLDAIDEFVEGFIESLAEIPEQIWLQQINGLTGQWLEKDANLRVRSQRFWTAIANKDVEFNLRERVVAEIQALTPEAIIEFANTRIAKSANPARMTLYSVCDKNNGDRTINGQYVENTESFLKLAQLML